ncbi:hypothetical protein HK102_002442 [Quaeritorhiza haematococci]|nr:hypothetical protein HK102_002442 [Quaeritorhiza haematococci]
MGGQLSVSMKDITNRAVTNVLLKQSNTCTATSGAAQTINISDLVAGGNIEISDITQTGEIGFNFGCTSNTKNVVDLQNQLKNEIDEQMQMQMSGLLLGQVQQNSSYQRAVSNIVNNVDITIVSTVVTTCLADNEGVIDNANTIDSIVKSKTAMTLKGISFGFAEILLAISLCLVLPCILSSVMFGLAGLAGGGSESGAGGPFQQFPQQGMLMRTGMMNGMNGMVM